MLFDEPPLSGGAAPLNVLPVEIVPEQPPQARNNAEKARRGEIPPRCLLAPAIMTETTLASPFPEPATEPPPPVFRAGSISVRKDMVARLPAMHIPDFKRNLRNLDQPSIKVNELKLTSACASKLSLCESSLKVLNTPNVRPRDDFLLFPQNFF